VYDDIGDLPYNHVGRWDLAGAGDERPPGGGFRNLPRTEDALVVADAPAPSTKPRLALAEAACRFYAFTLIEVLVVVAILALLIAVLLPSLNAARRRAKVAVCASRVSQICRGLSIYAAENRGLYPSRKVIDANFIQMNRTARPDMRRFLYYTAASKQADVLWCPLLSSDYYLQPKFGYQELMDEEDRNLWSKVFFVCDFGNPRPVSYMMGYNLLAGMQPDRSHNPITFLWGKSGNYGASKILPSAADQGHEPREAGHPQDVIVTDVNEAWPAAERGTPLNPYRTFHAKNPEPAPRMDAYWNRFIDTNVGYGDGRVELHKILKYYVARDGYGSQATAAFSY